jgi:hypothetical protein
MLKNQDKNIEKMMKFENFVNNMQKINGIKLQDKRNSRFFKSKSIMGNHNIETELLEKSSSKDFQERGEKVKFLDNNDILMSKGKLKIKASNKEAACNVIFTPSDMLNQSIKKRCSTLEVSDN